MFSGKKPIEATSFNNATSLAQLAAPDELLAPLAALDEFVSVVPFVATGGVSEDN